MACLFATSAESNLRVLATLSRNGRAEGTYGKKGGKGKKEPNKTVKQFWGGEDAETFLFFCEVTE